MRLLKPIKNYYFRIKGYSLYHAEIAADPMSNVEEDFEIKKEELVKSGIFKKIRINQKPVRVAVLGCADNRYVNRYNQFFNELFSSSLVDIYDITTSHLSNKENIFEHDCTQKLPKSYDIIYSHLLLNFLPPKKQYQLIKNSEESLNKRGYSLHVLARDEEVSKFRIHSKMWKKGKSIKSRGQTFIIPCKPYFD